MYNKILGAIFAGIGLYILLGALGAFSNDWPMKKILFVSGIQLTIAIFPLIIGIKLLKKKADINTKKVN
jgi:hypothetical protein